MELTIYTLFFLVIGLAGLFVCLGSCIEEDETGLIVGAIMALPASLIVISTIYIPMTTNNDLLNTSEWDIYALEDNMSINGSRYYFEEDMKYYYMAKYKDGMKMYDVPKNMTYIVESNDQPKIVMYEYGTENFLTKLLCKLKIFEDKYFVNQKEYRLTVPSETITSEFNIDMK